MRGFLALAALAAVTACAPTMVTAPAGPYAAGAIGVNLDNSWTSIPPQLNGVTTGSVLTRHGVALDRVDIMRLQPGQSILRAARNVDVPLYRAGMSETELVELVTASLARVGFTDVSAENVRAYQLAGAPGVRFNLVGKYHSGLNLRGDAAVAESNGALSVILFLAPAQHYYDASATEIEHLMQSARVS